MAKTNWGLNDVVQPSDLNGIGQEINQLREDVDNMDFPLSDATDGTRSDVAASEKAVGLVMQEAQAAKQAGNERKSEVVAALVAKGISASTSESWDSLLSKLTSLIKATGNATAADVLAGKTFSNASGNNIAGSMPNRGAVNQTITTQGGQYTIPAGCHNGSGKVTANFANLVPENVKKNVNIGGVVGALQPGGSIDVDVHEAGSMINGWFATEPFLTIPSGTKKVTFMTMGAVGNSSMVFGSTSETGPIIYLALGDGTISSSNYTALISSNSVANQARYIHSFTIDLELRKFYYLASNSQGQLLYGTVDIPVGKPTDKMYFLIGNSTTPLPQYIINLTGRLVYA
ncbi:tail fiber protein [Paenibacillus barengoltzii]|uniref:tail fiber protein n=1 Tax=Paenibacillus barengoltzii TaxID=343517 RepID=UPI000FDA44E7|nr:tail fiber protein [Paenibacillus barengoltzii]